ISADYFKQDALKASQRESTKTAYLPGLGLDQTSSFGSFPANIAQTISTENGFETFGFAGLLNPTIPFPNGATPSSCARPYSLPTGQPPSPSAYTCNFDYASVIETIPEAEKANFVGRLTWQIDADNQFFAEGSYYYC